MEEVLVSPASVAPLRTGATVLQVRHLTTEFSTPRGQVRAVEDVSFDVAYGEIHGIVGESGSGKSITASSIIRLLPGSGRITDGEVVFAGTDLLGLNPAAMSAVRGRKIGFISQDPMTSLNPTLTVGYQLAEPMRVHLQMGRREARRRAVELLGEVGIPNPRQRVGQYPHEFSGGMLQRAVIAMAMLCQPDLLIADEPTTALDVTIQAQILELLRTVTSARRSSAILITHDFGVAARVCDRISVMYAGQFVESGTTRDVLTAPLAPYTRDLLRCVPSLDDVIGARFDAIPGKAPEPGRRPPGCRFADRCSHARELCRAQPPALTERSGVHCARCFGSEQGGWIV
jgi:oligopeptide/dipeptide ABC transporter ATP-binding protein